MRGVLSVLFFLAIVVTMAFLVLPVVAIFVHVPLGRLLHELTNPIVTDALIVSLKTVAIAQVAILLFGTPTAYFLASRRFRGRPFLVTLVELPLVLPPAVAGIGLMAVDRIMLSGADGVKTPHCLQSLQNLQCRLQQRERPQHQC